jgi:arylsulfatase
VRTCRASSDSTKGIVAYEDWLVTFAAIAGDIYAKQHLLERATLNGRRRYKNHLDGRNQVDDITGKAQKSPRKEFWYVNDGGQVVAARYADWKVVFLENRGEAFGVRREPFVELRVPLLFNVRRKPFERTQHNANGCNEWPLERTFVLVPIQALAGQFLQTMKEYPPSQAPGAFTLTKIEKQVRAGAGSR